MINHILRIHSLSFSRRYLVAWSLVVPRMVWFSSGTWKLENARLLFRVTRAQCTLLITTIINISSRLEGEKKFQSAFIAGQRKKSEIQLPSGQVHLSFQLRPLKYCLPNRCAMFMAYEPIFLYSGHANMAIRVRTRVNYASLDFELIHTFNLLFAHLAALGFESIVFFVGWKQSPTRLLSLISLAHQTTKLPFSLAQEQNFLTIGPGFIPALNSSLSSFTPFFFQYNGDAVIIPFLSLHSRDHLLKEWDISTCTCLRSLQGHRGPVFCVKVRLCSFWSRLHAPFNGGEIATSPFEVKSWQRTHNVLLPHSLQTKLASTYNVFWVQSFV